MAQAQGTRYALDGRDPFAPFDLNEGRTTRLPHDALWDATFRAGFTPAAVL